MYIYASKLASTYCSLFYISVHVLYTEMCVCITSFNLKINQRYLASILDLAVKYCPYHFTDTIIEICST